MVEKNKTLNITLLKVSKLDVMCVHIVGGISSLRRQMNRSVSRDMRRGDSNHALNADYVNAPRAPVLSLASGPSLYFIVTSRGNT